MAKPDEDEVVVFQDPIGEPIVIGNEPRLRSDLKWLPSDKFAVPDTVLDGTSVPGLAIRGVSLRGDEHRYYGTTRQDSMGIWRVADSRTEAFLVCVADGVGSQPLSQLGSAKACPLLRTEVMHLVTPLLTADEKPELCQGMMQRVAQGLVDMASEVDADPKELSTTLAGAVIETSPMSPEERRYVAFGVGDSGAFLLRDATFHSLFEDQHDAMITSTVTNALPVSVGQAMTCGGVLVPGDVLMICTDGLINPMRNGKVARQLAEWWGSGTVPGLPQFGWQLSFRAKSFSDDRTAVCAWEL